MDMEKVIKGLECAIGIRGRKNCDDCPYDNDFNCLGCDIVMRDALELLKAQRETIDELISADKLLKEQDDEIKELRSMVEFWKEKALHT